MARSVDITVPAGRTEPLLRDLESLDGVLGVRVQEGISRRPPGDVVTVLTTSGALHPLLRLLDRHHLGSDPAASITLSEPSGVISAGNGAKISAETTETPWEEMEFTIARESNMSVNALIVMGTAGLFAAVGIATGALHLVIAGMLIAPGFEPIVRVALGLVARAPVWKRGLANFASGYAALLAGGMLGSGALLATGRALPSSEASYLELGALATYWTSISAPGVLVSGVAALTGAILIANNRSVLTAGVMVALALTRL